jgi:hypothetical protein
VVRLETESEVLIVRQAYEIVPGNAFVGVLLGVLFLYLSFRYILFALMIADVMLGWLRKFAWFPKEGRRKRTVVHWIMAIALFFGFLVIAESAGWLQFVPR